MSKKKAGGKVGQHVSPEGKHLGLKVPDGKEVSAGVILVRQRGKNVSAGRGVEKGRDYTLYATSSGVVKYGHRLGKKTVSVN